MRAEATPAWRGSYGEANDQRREDIMTVDARRNLIGLAGS